MRQPQSRNPVIDASKGFAILLVVLGHALQTHLADPDRNLLFRIIYSFHMPFFFLLSGWVLKPDTPGRTKKTLTRLIPPTIAWYIIQYMVERRYQRQNLGAWFLDFLRSPDNGLWFLWVLAFCILALIVCRKLELRVGVSAYLIGWGVLIVFPVHILGVPLIRDEFPFLVIGYLLARRPLFVERASLWAVPVAAISFVAVLPFWQRSYHPAAHTSSWIIAGHHLPVQALLFEGARLIEGCAGSALAAFFAFLLWRWLHLGILLWLGRQSLEIYVSHQLFVDVLPPSGFLAIAATFFIALIGSLALAAALKKIPRAALVLYGEQKQATVNSEKRPLRAYP